MKKIIVFFASFLLFFGLVKQSYAIDTLENKNDKLILDFYFLESEYNEEGYINVNNLEDFNFIKYDGKQLPQTKNVKRRMYTFIGYFHLSEALKDDDLSLYIGFTDYPYNIYLNKVLIYKGGQYKNNSTSRIYYIPNIYLSKDLLSYGSNNTNEIAIEVFPSYEKEALGEIAISSYENVAIWSFFRNFVGVYLIKAGAIISLLVCIYFLFLFFSRKGKDLRYLYFSGFCFVFTFSWLDITLYYDVMSEILFLKIARNGLIFSNMFLSLFVMEFTQILKSKWFRIGAVIIALTLSLILIFQDTKQHLEDSFTIILNACLFPLLLLQCLLLLISFFRYKNRYSIIIVIAFVLLTLSGLHDTFFFSINIFPYAWYTSYGYIALILGIFYVLAKEHSNTYLETIKQAKELKEKNIVIEKTQEELKISNEHLEELVKKRTIDLNNANEELIKRNEQLLNDLKMAQRVQRSIIPTTESLPKRKELKFGSDYSAMESIGGDLFDVIKIGKNGYGFLIADVSGHGVPAALITTMVKVFFYSHSGLDVSSNRVCKEVNKELLKFIGDLDYYVTAFYGILNIETGLFQYTNAGHHPAIVYRTKTEEIIELDTEGFFIGAIENANYGRGEIIIDEGDKILLFTDGIVEARNKDGEFYEKERLIDFFLKNVNLQPKEFVDKLTKDIDKFCEYQSPSDDRAVLYINFISKMAPEQLPEDSIHIEAKNIDEKSNISLEPMYKRALDYYKNKEFKKAIDIFIELEKTYPNNINILNYLGILYYKMKDYSNAYEVFSKALKLDENNSIIKKNLSIVKKNKKM